MHIIFLRPSICTLTLYNNLYANLDPVKDFTRLHCSDKVYTAYSSYKSVQQLRERYPLSAIASVETNAAASAERTYSCGKEYTAVQSAAAVDHDAYKPIQ